MKIEKKVEEGTKIVKKKVEAEINIKKNIDMNDKSNTYRERNMSKE